MLLLVMVLLCFRLWLPVVVTAGAVCQHPSLPLREVPVLLVVVVVERLLIKETVGGLLLLRWVRPVA